MTNKTLCIYLKKDGSNDKLRDQIANELLVAGYAVDPFASLVCVNGKRLPNGRLQMLTQDEAEKVANSYLHRKAEDIESGIRIDIVYAGSDK